MPLAEVTPTTNDHDLLIQLDTKLQFVVDKLTDIPGTCVRHSEEIKTHREDLDKLQNSITWAWRFSLGSIITAIISAGGIILQKFLGG